MKTPYIIVQEKTLNKNIERMANIMKEHKVALRPHIKTHKIPEIALKQVKAGAVGITVATISEAEVMLENGVSDIFIAYPIVSAEKAKKVCDLTKSAENIIVGVDSYEGIEVLNKVALEEEVTLKVRLEIDTGLNRTGVDPKQSVDYVKVIDHKKGLTFEGIYTFRGSVLNGEATKDTVSAGKDESKMMIDIANHIRENGYEVHSISVGSSPTAVSAATVSGVTEIRPGTYVFNDVMQALFEVCDWEDCATQVVVTVVSKHGNRIVVDGGSKTFATDVQPNNPPLNIKGFGKVLLNNELEFNRMNEEHGVIIGDVEDIQIGDQIRIIPNHICSTVNLHDYIYIESEDGKIVKQKVKARGKLQ